MTKKVENENPRRRQARGLPDLSALFEEVDSQGETISGKTPGANLPDSKLGLTPAAVPRIKDPQTLLSRLDGEAEDDSSQALPALPSELERYLPPDLWRKVNSPNASRGVLINALERVRSVLYLISTFLPSHLVQEKMRRPYAGAASGQILKGTLLFSDVSGFTALSERLAAQGPQGAELLTRVMNQYFTTMLEILAWSGGILLKFAGDATLVYFPEQEGWKQAHWAVRAAQRMLRAMSTIERVETSLGAVQLQMKIGIASGEFLAASAGSPQRMEYFVIGQTVSQTMAAEGMTKGGGQIVVDEATLEAMGADADQPPIEMSALKNGFCLLTGDSPSALDDFEIKVEARRGRGGIPWSASPRAIVGQAEVALRQIQALIPYLAPELVEQVVTHARRRKVDSEYRPTTVMFCNFCGPEKLLESWGADGAQRITSLLNIYFASMSEVIAHFGGIVSRVDPYSTGTKMLVLFGAPVAHEDDPQRAVSAALAMNAELETLEENWRQRYARYLPDDLTGALIQQRIGITFGDTFAGQVGSSTRREYTVMGDEVNLAARLMGAAEMCQILISPGVGEIVADDFVLTEMPPLRLKGKRKAVSPFQVDGPREDTLAKRAHSRGLLIGREAELAQAEKVIQQLLEGSGSILVIEGPSGIGKSHLADELLNRLNAYQARVLTHQCHAYHSETPYANWSGLLRSLAGITALDYQAQIHYEKFHRLAEILELPQEDEHKLMAMMGIKQPQQNELLEHPEEVGSPDAPFDFVRQGNVRRRGSRLEFLQGLETLQTQETTGKARQRIPGHQGSEEQDKLHTAVWLLLERLAAILPTIIFFEDAHYMDSASRAVLGFIKTKTNATPLMILMAQRSSDEQAGDIPPEELGQVISLHPLNQADTQALVAHLLAADLAEVIREQSSGNPMIVDEITRWFRRTHQINADELRNVLQGSNFLQKLVLSGLENLPEAQREIARAAAVISSAPTINAFRTGEVQALMETMDSVTLSNHLRALAREHLITLTEGGADALYSFQQTLVRDILYTSLPFEKRREYHDQVAAYLGTPRNQRRQVHARIAAALDAGLSKDPALEAETIAFHCECAGQWLAAAQNTLSAGEVCRQQGVYERACDYYNRALDDLEKIPADQFGAEAGFLKSVVQIRQGDMALWAGDSQTAISAYEAALAGLPEDASLEMLVDIRRKLALALPLQNRAEEALEKLREALDRPGAPQEFRALVTAAWLSWRSGRPDTKAWIEKCRALQSHGTGMPASEALLLEFAGDLPTAKAQYSASGLASGAALITLRMGIEQLNQGEIPSAIALFQEADQLWQNEPEKYNGRPLALFEQAEALWQSGDTKSARAALQNALKILPTSSPALQAAGRQAIQRALRVLAKPKSRRWPPFKWQAYDDLFRLSILFQAG